METLGGITAILQVSLTIDSLKFVHDDVTSAIFIYTPDVTIIVNMCAPRIMHVNRGQRHWCKDTVLIHLEACHSWSVLSSAKQIFVTKAFLDVKYAIRSYCIMRAFL